MVLDFKNLAGNAVFEINLTVLYIKILIFRIGEMFGPKTVTTHCPGLLGLPDKCCAIKYFVCRGNFLLR